ncbi:MAG: energy-coupling factor transporter ATPase [Oscillospiraceae bacterium]|jgi:energy-coupling factor transport system ATP-binding protein|nr:energy-coupling factor transporter ATPase [Oscillospiraceae bacterium]
MIEAVDLSHTYGSAGLMPTAAVTNVTLTIPDNCFAAIIGSTGSGKTTLIQHFNGLLKPSSGKVLIDGEDINATKQTRKESRRKVGMVFQYPEHQLFEETIEKDVAFGCRNLGLSDAVCRDRAREALGRVGMDFDEFAQRSPFELSGGQMRRVAIAGVLSMRPSTLVLDEPTAGLDPRGRTELLDLLDALRAEGDTIVLVSHSMEDVAERAKLVFVMHDGKLAAQGEPREIFMDADRLRAVGLSPPSMVLLAEELAKLGIVVPRGIMEVDEMKEAIITLMRSEGGTNEQ